jgi:hypothetical protein
MAYPPFVKSKSPEPSKRRRRAPTRIPRAEIRTALKRSGYLLEYRAARALEELGWSSTSNYAFSDPKTETTRELDLVAEQRLRLKGQRGLVRVIMVVECVHNPQPMAMFSRAVTHAELHLHAFRLGGNPSYVVSPGGVWNGLLSAAGATDWHHYCATQHYATQYCSFAKKRENDDWMALHDGPHFACLQALFDALNHLRAYGVRSIQKSGIPDTVTIELYYPCLLLQGDLVEVVPSARSIKITNADRLFLQRGVIDERGNNVFFIDVVRERGLPAFAQLLMNEASRLVRYLDQNADTVHHSLQQLQQKLQERNLKAAVIAQTGAQEPVPAWPPFAT